MVDGKRITIAADITAHLLRRLRREARREKDRHQWMLSKIGLVGAVGIEN